MTISAVAENKNIEFSGIDVYVSRSPTVKQDDETLITVEIELKGNLSRRERILMFNSARKCEVSKLLLGDLRLDYRLLGNVMN